MAKKSKTKKLKRIILLLSILLAVVVLGVIGLFVWQSYKAKQPQVFEKSYAAYAAMQACLWLSETGETVPAYDDVLAQMEEVKIGGTKTPGKKVEAVQVVVDSASYEKAKENAENVFCILYLTVLTEELRRTEGIQEQLPYLANESIHEADADKIMQAAYKMTVKEYLAGFGPKLLPTQDEIILELQEAER